MPHFFRLFHRVHIGSLRLFEAELSFRHRAENSADRSRHFFIPPGHFPNESVHCHLVSMTSMPRSGECVIGMRIAYGLHHEATIAFVNQQREEIAMPVSVAGHGLCWEQLATDARCDREPLGVSVRKEDVKMDI